MAYVVSEPIGQCRQHAIFIRKRQRARSVAIVQRHDEIKRVLILVLLRRIGVCEIFCFNKSMESENNRKRNRVKNERTMKRGIDPLLKDKGIIVTELRIDACHHPKNQNKFVTMVYSPIFLKNDNNVCDKMTFTFR
jgi:hypothetical protein